MPPVQNYSLSSRKDFRSQRPPCDRIGIVGLSVLSGPETGSGNGEKRRPLSCDDGFHDDVVSTSGVEK